MLTSFIPLCYLPIFILFLNSVTEFKKDIFKKKFKKIFRKIMVFYFLNNELGSSLM